MRNDLPQFLDESKDAPSPEFLGQAVMTITGGTGKGRGNINFLRVGYNWRTVLFSTGEVPTHELYPQTGVRARTVCYYGNPFKKDDRTLIEAIERLMINNYGHLGPLFLEKFVVRENFQDAADVIKKVYKSKLEKLYSMIGSRKGIEDRIMKHMAITWTAAFMFHNFFKEELGEFDFDKVILDKVKDSKDDLKEMPLFIRALDLIWGWVSSNKKLFKEEGAITKDSETHGTEFGIEKQIEDDDCICIVPDKLSKMLSDHKMSSEIVLKLLKEENVIKCTEGRRMYKVRFNGHPRWMVVLDCNQVKIKLGLE